MAEGLGVLSRAVLATHRSNELQNPAQPVSQLQDGSGQNVPERPQLSVPGLPWAGEVRWALGSRALPLCKDSWKDRNGRSFFVSCRPC